MKDARPNFNTILKLHDESTRLVTESLPESFGDALCLQISPLAKNVREAFTRKGGRFLKMESSADLDYYFLMTQLNFAKGYENGQIYYIDTTTPLLKLLSIFKDLETVDSSLLGIHFCGDERRIFYKSSCFMLLKETLGPLAAYEHVQTKAISYDEWVASHMAVQAASLSLEFLACIASPTYLNFLVTRINFVNFATYPDDFAILKELFANYEQKEIFGLFYFSTLILLTSHNEKLIRQDDLKVFTETNFDDRHVSMVAQRAQKSVQDSLALNASLKHLISFGLDPEKAEQKIDLLNTPEALPVIKKVEALAHDFFAEVKHAN